MYSSWGVAFACIIVLVCCEDVRRRTPGNFICLAVFTGQSQLHALISGWWVVVLRHILCLVVCESFMLGTIASFYTTDAVLMALGTTVAVTLALTLFAFQTKIDFTGCGGEDKNKHLKFYDLCSWWLSKMFLIYVTYICIIFSLLQRRKLDQQNATFKSLILS